MPASTARLLRVGLEPVLPPRVQAAVCRARPARRTASAAAGPGRPRSRGGRSALGAARRRRWRPHQPRRRERKQSTTVAGWRGHSRGRPAGRRRCRSGSARPVEVHWRSASLLMRGLLGDGHLDPAELAARVGEPPDQGGADMAERGAGRPVRGGLGCEKPVPLVGRQRIPPEAPHGIQAADGSRLRSPRSTQPLDLVPRQPGAGPPPWRAAGRQGMEQRWSCASTQRWRGGARRGAAGRLAVDAVAPGESPVRPRPRGRRAAHHPPPAAQSGCADPKSTESGGRGQSCGVAKVAGRRGQPKRPEM